MKAKYLLLTAGILCLLTASVHADTFGSGGNTFSIDFVTIGNAGNADDAGAGGGLYSSPYGGVSYVYQMGVTEVSQDWITKATNLGMTNVTAGPWAGNQPAANLTWYEAAAFVNFLNTSTGNHAGYQLDAAATALTLWTSGEAWKADGENLYRHKDAYYFLPTEDEWYKAAYHKNDGVTANYWDYATASNSVPVMVAGGTVTGTAVWGAGAVIAPAAVDNDGGISAYGTQGQNGNINEWQENSVDGANDNPSDNRVLRGGSYLNASDTGLRSSFRNTATLPSFSVNAIGFRVASAPVGTGSVPEPAGAALLGLGTLLLAVRRRWSV